MAKRSFMVVASTHVDLAWKWGPEEMTEMVEVLAVRVLDALESDPTFKYTLEQAAHYRVLARTRPDLVKRLGEYVKSGRLEMAGCMASTLDTNLPSGESYVRNQLIGIAWVRENWGVYPQTGRLVDTFGINAQVPQIMRQFGLRYFTATRFGGDKVHDVFIARGLDGSEVVALGHDAYSPNLQPRFTSRVCYYHWDGIDKVFADADKLEGDGPFSVQPNNENEYLVSLKPFREVRERNAARPNEIWTVGTYADYVAELDRAAPVLPVEDGDLNPEFTGCFSLRAPIRLRNRRAEGLLIEAEKWACFTGLTDVGALTESWWDMAFVQFHDVFTGSHPTHVYDRVISTFDRIDAASKQVLDSAVARFADRPSTESSESVTLLNGLPWSRSSVVELTDVDTTNKIESVVDGENRAVPFELHGGKLFVRPSIPACGAERLVIKRSVNALKDVQPAEVSAATLENEFLRVELNAAQGIARIIWKPTGRVIVENAGGLVVAQKDGGNFQIESPEGAEVLATTGTIVLETPSSGPCGQRAVLSGRFPALTWAGAGMKLDWKLDLSLAPGEPGLQVGVSLDWKGEGTRIRLRVPTMIDTASAIYEVPFGTVRRKPYGIRGTARGEWPAQRFVLLQDSTHGLAVINNGAAGVEAVGGVITTSLVRAPRSVYSGMLPDETSSGHGHHHFKFVLAPFEGEWSGSAVLRLAQELNTPMVVRAGQFKAVPSQMALTPANVVMSTVKRPENGASDTIIIRVYESAGIASTATLTLAGMQAALKSDLREQAGEALTVADSTVKFDLKPFEIVTVLAKRG